MRLDDLSKLATGSVLFNLDRIIAPRLVKVLYLLGLGALLVWAVRHFFASFRWGFGAGLWGILEIVVFGLLAFVLLRILCEGVMVYFRAHAEAAETAAAGSSGSLLDDVREAIEELAEEEAEAEERTVAAEEARQRWTPPRSWGPAPGKPNAASGTTAVAPAAPATPQPPAGEPPAPAAADAGTIADTSPEYEVPEGSEDQPSERRPSTEPGSFHS